MEAVHTSAKAEASSGPSKPLTGYEWVAAICGLAGLLSLLLGCWMVWRPLAPLTLGVALLYGAWLAARCARAEASAERPSRIAARRRVA